MKEDALHKPLPETLQAARFQLTRSHRYIAGVLMNMTFVEKEGLGTLGVDKYWRCYYDPLVVEEWKGEGLRAVLYHEVNHLLRGHPKRGEHFEDKEKTNKAGDIEINPDIRDMGMKLPGQPLFPSTFGLDDHDKKLMEEYYHLIPDEPGQGKGKGKGKDKPGPGSGECGSCAGGKPRDYEDPAPGEGEGLSEGEREIIKRQVAKEIEATVKQQGNVPAGLRRWAETLLHPQVKWTKELAAQVRRSMIEVMGKQDRTFRRLSRVASALGGGVVLPGSKSHIPSVAIVFDTSGSMGQSDLAKSITEAKGVLQAIGGAGFGVTTISVDCAVGGVRKVQRVSAIELSGGGGTDMGIGIAAAQEVTPKVDVCIVMTDGYTPWPSEAPPFKTIVCLTQKGAENQVPSWAKTIIVN